MIETEPAIRVRDLRKLYGGKPAVDGLSFDVPRGCFFGFLGPNGAGKTTTIRMLIGLAPPDSGEIELLGLPMPGRAIENFRKALAGDDSDPIYHFNLGYALWRQRDFAAAAERFRAVLDRDPSDAVATYLLGHCLQKTAPRVGDTRTANLERIKENYEERAYLQLKAELGSAAGVR